MQPQRHQLTGPPHTYYVTAQCALRQELLAGPEAQHFLDLVADLCRCVDGNLFAYAIDADAYHLIIQHRDQVLDADQELQRRWRSFGGAAQAAQPDRLRTRFASLGGIMQTLAQRYSRAWHQRNGGRGGIWAERYRACLLADASALLCAVAWLEYGRAQGSLLSSRGRHQRDSDPPLALLPLREHSDGSVLTADSEGLLLVPPAAERIQSLLDSFAAELDAEAYTAYEHALTHGWALGRPESLIEATARLGRSTGRGRSRRIRELDDQLGLCGFWG
ncbi:MAG: hypothetical protein ACOCXJ_01995 [Planctomycetota bacterium]